MEVKYIGEKGLHYHNIDWFTGDIHTVSKDLDFNNSSFEIVEEKVASPTKTVTKSKKSSKED